MKFYNSRKHLTLLFQVRNLREAKALRYWRSAFAGATEVEELQSGIVALHVFPGVREDAA